MWGSRQPLGHMHGEQQQQQHPFQCIHILILLFGYTRYGHEIGKENILYFLYFCEIEIKKKDSAHK